MGPDQDASRTGILDGKENDIGASGINWPQAEAGFRGFTTPEARDLGNRAISKLWESSALSPDQFDPSRPDDASCVVTFRSLELNISPSGSSMT